MRRFTAFALGVLLLSQSASPSRAAARVTLETLLRQMTDLSLLAEFPDPPYVTRQFSSYERASEKPGNAEWFANHDRGFPLYDGTIKEKTSYYKSGPQQGRPPEGFFAPGTKVGLAPNVKANGDYVWAYATGPDGGPINGKIPQGFIPKDAVTLDPHGHVLAEMDGPGCVVRIWSANPQDAGNLRIYLDGAQDPLLNAPMTDLLSGKWQAETDGKKWTPFPEPLAHERSRGFNLYFPIAYAKHCKITVDKPDIYYHVDYRTYPEGTEVETFRLSALLGAQERLTAVQEQLAGAAAGQSKQPTPTIPLKQATGLGKMIEPGQDLKVSFDGPGVLRRLQLSVTDFLREGTTFSEAEALRGLVLVGTFDGAPRPQIWCPLGDFFASSPGVNEYNSLPFQVARDEHSKHTPKAVLLTALWPMPFEKSAVFEVRNLGKARAYVDLHGINAAYEWTDRSMHFHAKWRTETLRTRPFRDWTYCDLKGKGVFVGDMLSLMNPVAAWWGEGDEKVYVDGERFPSWFGTGTEDYYGYAWSDPTPFQHAYHNQTRCDGPGTRGHTSVNRFHILDAIPFTKSFKFDMEFWHWTPNTQVPYAATSYWYARPDATDDFKEVDAKVLQTIPEAPAVFRLPGAIEGEKLKVLGKSSEFPVTQQDMSEFPYGKWSGEAQLWGRPEKKGEWADLELPVAADGTYKVQVYLTRARDYGVVQFHLDGKPAGKPFDGFEPEKVLHSDAIDLGTVELKKGTATLRIEVVDTNAKSVGVRYMWGLDCVMLKPAP
jgi:hypothetical protein